MADDNDDNGWADNVDYGDDDDGNDAMNVNGDSQDNGKKDGWADNVDYGDDDDDEDQAMLDEDGIGDLGLTDDDDDDLPPDNAMGAPQQQFKSEITSTLDNPYRIGVSYKLEFDPKDTPGDISDDDETAPGLRINHFQLCTAKQAGVVDSGDAVDTLLGSGSFAKVLRARNTRNGKLVALKCMFKNLLRKQFLMKSRYNLDDEDDAPNLIRHTMLDAVQTELQMMMKMRHINVIRLYYIIDDPTKDSLYLAIEYSSYGQVMDFDGRLLQYIPSRSIAPKEKYIVSDTNVAQPWWYNKYVVNDKESNEANAVRDTVNRFNEDTARKLFMDCVKGVQYLHDLNIIHRDIKPENLLLFEDTNHECGLMVKIADFGTAEQFNSKEEAILIDTQGTYHFMSPSAIGGDKRNAFYDDIWALGIVLYSFIFGTVPFFHPLDYQLFESIQKDALVLPKNEILSASDHVRDLIQNLLLKKDEERISLLQIEKHLWYNGYVHPDYVLEDDEPPYDPNHNCCVLL